MIPHDPTGTEGVEHMNSIRTVLGAALLALLAIPTSGAQAQDDTFEWSGRMSSGQTLEIRGIVGEIRATLASGSTAAVVARKRGDSDDFHQVAVEMAEDGGTIIICAVYGQWNHGEGRCHPDHRDWDDDDRRRKNVDMDVEVEYEVRVPAGVDFEGMMVTGDIRAEELGSDVSVNTVTGHISVTTTGRAWANSVSGNIEVAMGDFSGGDLDFQTVSGDITLWLPGDFSADVDFNSLSGDFDTDFDLNIQKKRGRWVGMTLEGTIGGGGRDLKLNTVSGDVELWRARGR
jgi:hypothetical protein